MFCSNCGKEIADKAIICVNCGCKTGNFENNEKSMVIALLLWFFLGGFGAHRFYFNRIGSGVCMLLCLLFCWLIIPAIILFIWWLIDLILILTDNLKPKEG